jgi:hypothetical protein
MRKDVGGRKEGRKEWAEKNVEETMGRKSKEEEKQMESPGGERRSA